MGVLSRIIAPFKAKAAEGEYRDGPYTLPVSGGWLPSGTPWNFWQMGQDVRPFAGHSAMVEACVSAYAQTIAMCPGDHWRLKPDGGRERITTSGLTRILRRPNDYQSISDFLMNLTRSLYQSGSAYALATRNERFEINALHLMRSRECGYAIAEDGSVFYRLGGNELVERRFDLRAVPARDVLHVRLHTPRHPLEGETPILAAAMDIAAGNAAVERQLAFFRNEAKPSIMLSTDKVLTFDQANEARASWDAQTRGGGRGGTPILSGGFKPIIVSGTAKDAELAEFLKLSDRAVALAFRVPLQVLGVGDTPFASTEALMQSWIASGLGFALNHIEEAIGNLFGLRGQPEEYVEFNTAVLLRSAFKDRVEGYAAGALAGIFSPDEARAEFELARVSGGHGALPRMQQQVVPLNYWDDARLAAEAKPEAPTVVPTEPEPDDTEKAVAALRMKFAEALHVA